MEVTGIVAEYNPFHNGHLYQILETKKKTACDFIVVVMSGNFSQRGTATICDKFSRTQMALANGADLVLELPVPFATASAEFFAHYAISALRQTHIVTKLSFGSECGDLTCLKQIASTIIQSTNILDDLIQKHLKQGLSFPRAHEQALLHLLQNHPDLKGYFASQLASVIQSPNNILGIEYLKALLRQNADITPITILRKAAQYHETTIQDTQIASATAIRKQLTQGLEDYTSCVPSNVVHYLKQTSPLAMTDLSAFVHFKLMFSQLSDLYTIWDVPHSLIHSLVKHCKAQTDYEDLVTLATSKTYTRAAVQRSLLRLLLDIKEDTLQPILQAGSLPYLRVLGCRKTATPLLKAIKNKSDVPLITNLGKQYDNVSDESKVLIDYEVRATKLYHYLTKHSDLQRQDFTTPFLLV